MHRKSDSIYALSELEIALNEDLSSISYGKTDRRSLGNKGNFRNLSVKQPEVPNNIQQTLKHIEDRVNDIEKRIELIIIKINQIAKDSQGLNQADKILELTKKYDKIQYFVWESKEMEKQSRDIAESLRSKIIENRELADKNINILKTNNQLLLTTMESVLGQLIHKVEFNKIDTTKQLRKMCEAMQDICVVQTKIQNNQKLNYPTVVIREEPSALNQSSIYETMKERRSLPLRESKSMNPRKTASTNKRSHIKKKNSIF